MHVVVMGVNGVTVGRVFTKVRQRHGNVVVFLLASAQIAELVLAKIVELEAVRDVLQVPLRGGIHPLPAFFAPVETSATEHVAQSWYQCPHDVIKRVFCSVVLGKGSE